jgi:hypothetical protein
MHCALLATAGAQVTVLDPHPERLSAAARFGAAGTVRAERAPADVERVPGGADLVVEAVGRPEAWELAVAMAVPGGTVSLFGGCARDSTFTVPTARVHYDEVTLTATYHHAPPLPGARAGDPLGRRLAVGGAARPGDPARAAPGRARGAAPPARAGQVHRRSLEDERAVAGSAFKASHSASPTGCGRSRSASTVQRKPHGSSPAFTHRCAAEGGISSTSIGPSSTTGRRRARDRGRGG